MRIVQLIDAADGETQEMLGAGARCLSAFMLPGKIVIAIEG